ncbi:MAG: hypothetical protein WDN01_10965 [Rhizomicrobium sp.]
MFPPGLASGLRDALAATGALPQHGLLLRFFPVFDFQRHAVAALFCTPTSDAAEAIHGHPAFQDFSPAQWAQIDCAILNHALDFAATLARHGIVVAVGASVGFATLSDPRGRIAYREALRAAHAREQSYLVIKIEDIPARATAKRIGELVASLRLVAPRTWAHLPGSSILSGGHEPLHASGLVMSMPPKLPFHGMQTEARWLARQATLQAALACMDRVDSAAEFETVRAAGVRFAAGQAIGRPALAAHATPDDIRDLLYADGPVR